MDGWEVKVENYLFEEEKISIKIINYKLKIIPSQMEVAPLHCTVDITQKIKLFKNTKEG